MLKIRLLSTMRSRKARLCPFTRKSIIVEVLRLLAAFIILILKLIMVLLKLLVCLVRRRLLRTLLVNRSWGRSLILLNLPLRVRLTCALRMLLDLVMREIVWLLRRCRVLSISGFIIFVRMWLYILRFCTWVLSPRSLTFLAVVLMLLLSTRRLRPRLIRWMRIYRRRLMRLLIRA